jgi:predicted acetyltransferase
VASQRGDTRDIEIRAITEDELGAWAYVLDASFLAPMPAGAMAYRREFYVPGRSLGAFEAGRCVGTLRSLDLEVTVPGGAAVPAEGITNVGVLGSHRRRGLLTRMMRMALDDAVARGRPVAALIASEYRIYGRFGFGPATSMAGYEIDVKRAGGLRVPGGDGGRVEPLGLNEIREYGPGLYERFRRTQVGAIPRDAVMWRRRTGGLRNPYRDWTEPTAVLYRDVGGNPAGMALYRSDDNWRDGDPDIGLSMVDLFAVDVTATAALWRHLLTTEWVNRITAANVAPDDPLPLLLDNPRACVPRADTGQDHLWLRILDVARALEARSYGAPGRLVLDITDQLGYASGRFVLEAGPDGRASVASVGSVGWVGSVASVASVGSAGSAGSAGEPADLALDVSVLGTIYLGDQTVPRLAAAGLVAEQRPGAIARADRMLRTAARPWCPDGF